MYVKLLPPSPVRQGDILIRLKKSGFGYHYGTGLSNGLVKDNTPENGKHVTSLEGFQDGLPAWIIRPSHTPQSAAIVQQRALSNIGDQYNAGTDNCEHDMTYAQSGIPTSPTVNSLVRLGIVAGCLVIAANQPKSRRR